MLYWTGVMQHDQYDNLCLPFDLCLSVLFFEGAEI